MFQPFLNRAMYDRSLYAHTGHNGGNAVSECEPQQGKGTWAVDLRLEIQEFPLMRMYPDCKLNRTWAQLFSTCHDAQSRHVGGIMFVGEKKGANALIHAAHGTHWSLHL